MQVVAARQLLALPREIALFRQARCWSSCGRREAFSSRRQRSGFRTRWNHDLGKNAIGPEPTTPGRRGSSIVPVYPRSMPRRSRLRRNAPQLEGMEVAAFARIDATFLFLRTITHLARGLCRRSLRS